MRGLVFTLIILTLGLGLIFYISIQHSLIIFHGERLAVENRINAMKALHESIVLDGKRALEIIARRAITTAVGNIITSGKPLENANSTLAELIMNGTINGVPQALMENATLIDWGKKLEKAGLSLGFETKINFGKIFIGPFDSWNLFAKVDANISIVDLRGIANLTRSDILETLINIEEFEDPIYPLNTYGYAINKIIKSPFSRNFTKLFISSTGGNGWFYGLTIIIPSKEVGQIGSIANKNQKILVTDSTSGIENLVNQFGGVVSENPISPTITIPFVDNVTNAMSIIPNNTFMLLDGENGKVWYIENFKEHVNNSYYYPSLFGASFLDRLEGKLEVQEKYKVLTPNVIGIESFINKDKFFALGIPVDTNKTNIDYLYFSSSTVTSYRVKGMPENFRIDKELTLNNLQHSQIYGVDEILIS
jgi:phosphohistidine swiveling domain-containing protein